MNKTICFDYDDTLFDRTTSKPVPGAVEALKQLKSKNCKILISSARLDPELWGDLITHRIKEISDWLIEHDIPFDKIVPFKPPADLYIDDKAYRFKGNWETAMKEIPDLL